jgi:hypothetical protein
MNPARRRRAGRLCVKGRDLYSAALDQKKLRYEARGFLKNAVPKTLDLKKQGTRLIEDVAYSVFHCSLTNFKFTSQVVNRPLIVDIDQLVF